MTPFDHRFVALWEKLTSQFRNLVNWTKFLGACMDEVQEADDACVDLEEKTYLSNAAGAHLEQYGELLDEQRSGMLDDAYRNVLKVRLLSDHSDGTIPVLIEIVARLTGGQYVCLREAYPATVQISYAVDSPLTDTQRSRLTRLVARAVGGGCKLDWIAEAPIQYFGFEDDPNALGFGEGGWADVISR